MKKKKEIMLLREDNHRLFLLVEELRKENEGLKRHCTRTLNKNQLTVVKEKLERAGYYSEANLIANFLN